MNTKALSLVLASLAVSVAACASEVSTPDTGGSAVSPGDGTASPPAADPKPEYGYSCQGEATPKTLGLSTSVTPRCIGAGPDSGTFGGGTPNCGPSCGKQDVGFRYEPPAMRCGSKDLYYWSGNACVAQSTAAEGGMLRCTGNDCDKLYPSKEDCESAHTGCPQ